MFSNANREVIFKKYLENWPVGVGDGFLTVDQVSQALNECDCGETDKGSRDESSK